MPDSRMLVDVEALLVSHLLLDVDLGALVGGPGAGGRISTELPPEFADEDRVKVSRISGTEDDGEAGYLDRAIVQLDAYGATKEAAFAVVRQVFRATRAARSSVHAGAVVTAVERVSGPSWSPDPDTARPRYLLTVALTVHPTAG